MCLLQKRIISGAANESRPPSTSPKRASTVWTPKRCFLMKGPAQPAECHKRFLLPITKYILAVLIGNTISGAGPACDLTKAWGTAISLLSVWAIEHSGDWSRSLADKAETEYAPILTMARMHRPSFNTSIARGKLWLVVMIAGYKAIGRQHFIDSVYIHWDAKMPQHSVGFQNIQTKYPYWQTQKNAFRKRYRKRYLPILKKNDLYSSSPTPPILQCTFYLKPFKGKESEVEKTSLIYLCPAIRNYCAKADIDLNSNLI